MQLESKTHISLLLAIESPVAQWLEHPTRSRRVVGSNPIWGSDFFRVPSGFYQHLISSVSQVENTHNLEDEKVWFPSFRFLKYARNILELIPK